MEDSHDRMIYYAPVVRSVEIVLAAVPGAHGVPGAHAVDAGRGRC